MLAGFQRRRPATLPGPSLRPKSAPTPATVAAPEPPAAKQKRVRAKKVAPPLPDATVELGVTPAADSAVKGAPTLPDVTAKPQHGGGGNQLVCGTPSGLPDTMSGIVLPPQPQVVLFVVHESFECLNSAVCTTMRRRGSHIGRHARFADSCPRALLRVSA